VTRVDTPTGPVLVWSGDRWQQSPDGVSGAEEFGLGSWREGSETVSSRARLAAMHHVRS
jgi:hypothetical protein